ncbi:hypothetical protein NPIL_30091 [Nephila pilipes]|uniref:Uncharacterized protein n=1 Tax=Nephila pilipes TaxID=299642 RepID=A0A8X6U8E8_NEPPI|nr:hypothetical protein NPIL_30091 [Nephila pilipes]
MLYSPLYFYSFTLSYCTPHTSLDYSKGVRVVSKSELFTLSEYEILENLKDHDVIADSRINTCQEGASPEALNTFTLLNFISKHLICVVPSKNMCQTIDTGLNSNDLIIPRCKFFFELPKHAFFIF